MSQKLSIRREVVEYGSLPVAAWLSQADGISAVRALLVQLSERTAESSKGMCRPVFCAYTVYVSTELSLLAWL